MTSFAAPRIVVWARRRPPMGPDERAALKWTLGWSLTMVFELALAWWVRSPLSVPLVMGATASGSHACTSWLIFLGLRALRDDDAAEFRRCGRQAVRMMFWGEIANRASLLALPLAVLVTVLAAIL